MTRLTLAIAVLLVLWLLSNGAELSGTCPHEVVGLNIIGYNAPNGDCVTVVLRTQLTVANKNSYALSVYEAAKRYCETELNNGSLLFDLSSDISDMNITMLSENNENGPWTAFACSHKPYANCVLKMSSECVYNKEKDGCYFEYSVDNYVAQQLPYGKGCQWPLEMGRCQCPICSRTQWSSWVSYKGNFGRTFQTRYRPFDQIPHHSCSENSVLCCGDFRSDGELQMRHMGCSNGGILLSMAESICVCPRRYTGMLCELTSNKSENSFSMIEPYSTGLLHWLLITCLAVIVLLIFGMLAKCLQIADHEKKKHLVINVRDFDQSAAESNKSSRVPDNVSVQGERKKINTTGNYVKSVAKKLKDGISYNSRSRTRSNTWSRSAGTVSNKQRYVVSKDGRRIVYYF